ncbi:hypothetical protein PC122_g1058 [Phytophthora cactorum]|nr:hypothetical protein PC122_g1058 [Phytophthora cactorum]
MTRKRYRTLLIEKVFPAIRAKMPVRKGSTVYVQQDNAGPHVLEDDSELEAADLGYFSFIQALQYRKAC